VPRKRVEKSLYLATKNSDSDSVYAQIQREKTLLAAYSPKVSDCRASSKLIDAVEKDWTGWG